MERAQEPNLGLWSPPGGKLDVLTGESPYACACREVLEELGVSADISEVRLTGLVSEHGYGGETHWLLFLFELTRPLTTLPAPHREGRFQFFARSELEALPLPQSDRERIWPYFWEHRGGFFAAHCRCDGETTNQWLLEESRAVRTA
jgi:8-oxo-dGTP diphosphatase